MNKGAFLAICLGAASIGALAGGLYAKVFRGPQAVVYVDNNGNPIPTDVARRLLVERRAAQMRVQRVAYLYQPILRGEPQLPAQIDGRGVAVLAALAAPQSHRTTRAFPRLLERLYVKGYTRRSAVYAKRGQRSTRVVVSGT